MNHPLSNLRVQAAPALPTSIDLRPDVQRVEDQGPEESCTANAAVENLELLRFRRDPMETARFSRQFLYYAARALEHGADQDDGLVSMANLGVALQQTGVCLEETWPYDPNTVDTKPSDAAYAEAAHFQIQGFHEITVWRPGGQIDGNAMLALFRQTLAAGTPILIAMRMYASCSEGLSDQSDWRLHDFTPVETPSNALEGGHAVLVIGYDDTATAGGHAGRLLVQNSWGPDWGDGGFFGIPYEYLASTETEVIEQGFVMDLPPV